MLSRRLFVNALVFLGVASLLIISISGKQKEEDPDCDDEPESKPKKNGISKEIFPLRKYEDYQISSGKAGHAMKDATALFVTPFEGVDLAKLPEQDIKNLRAMAEECEEREKDFVKSLESLRPKIDDVLKKELRRGLYANKCAKLLGAIQFCKVQLAQHTGVDPAGQIKGYKLRLEHNAKMDAEQRGRIMKSFLDLKK